jgi:hypothetical protein
VYPNELVQIKGQERVRPFAAIIRAAHLLDGCISRDEIIVGPLSLSDDRDQSVFEAMIDQLRALRGKKEGAKREKDRLASRLGVQENTLRNYTRFPLGAMRWAQWTSESSSGGVVYEHLTESGKAIATWLNRASDIRANGLATLPPGSADAMIRLGALAQFDRGGLVVPSEDVASAERSAAPALTALGLSGGAPLLLTPFQEMPPERLAALFPLPTSPVGDVRESEAVWNPRPTALRKGEQGRPSRKAIVSLGPAIGRAPHAGLPELAFDGGPREIAKQLLKRGTGKDVFYPLVAELFTAAGLICSVSRPGVNYARADAVITHGADHIPIEIKSPDEEQRLSVKAVRQALENKVVFLSRGPATERKTVTMAVGLELPNDRSDVSMLIENVYETFGISISVTDFVTLVAMALYRVRRGRVVNLEFLNRRGFIEVQVP